MTDQRIRVIDSHLHLWDRSVSDYAWLGPQHGDLYDDFDAERAARELDVAGVDAAVLVQAEDSVVDTRYLLGIADTFDFVAGVVGWVALDDPATAARQLEEFAHQPKFRGVRQLTHIDPRADVLSLPEVSRSLAVLAEAGLPFDVPDAWPRDLGTVADLAADLPDLVVVVDHLGKPPRGRAGDLEAWAADLRKVAARPNTVAKVSGLQQPGQPFTTDALRPVLDIALDAFGASRLMYGGDWPMTVTDGGYQPHWEVIRELVGELSPSEQAQLLAGTASTVYGLQEGGAR
jgi:L-fuconolactonase